MKHDFDWHISDDDAEWRLSQQVKRPTALPEPTEGRRPAWVMRYRWLSVALLLVLSTCGIWAWRAAQRGIAQTKTEVRDSIEVELWTGIEVAQDAIEAELRAAMAAGEIVTELEIRDLGEDWALVDVQLLPTGNGPVYWQRRVYRYRNSKWERAAVAAEQWGEVRQLKSRYFVFYYGSVDHEVVTQVTTKMDELYDGLYASIFARTPVGEKLVVVLNPNWVSGQGRAAQSSARAKLIVPSPMAILAPTELPPDELLLQSLMLVLYDKLATNTQEEYKLSPQWLPLRNGLRHWFIWEQNLPLGIWRESLVQWTLGESEKAVQAPLFAHDLCVHHQLWMRSPLQVGVPIQCLQERPAGERIIAWRYRYRTQGLALPPVADVQVRPEDANANLMKEPPESAASSVAWATVLEYATTTFGPEKLPVLLAALPEHVSWETLVPAVFGLPLAEFERGWRDFLQEQYDIMP